MTALWFLVGALGLFDGWQAGNPALIIGGFGCILVAFALLLAHDYDAYADVALRPYDHDRDSA